jgi:hypothetical protein
MKHGVEDLDGMKSSGSIDLENIEALKDPGALKEDPDPMKVSWGSLGLESAEGLQDTGALKEDLARTKDMWGSMDLERTEGLQDMGALKEEPVEEGDNICPFRRV